MAPQDTDDDTRARRRLKGFALHLMAYFIVVTVCAVLNHLKTPDQLWFIYPMVAWGAPLALHAAWVMGLFDGLARRK
ncbi:MAG: 2TM domain-containing protein [Rhodospirillales bacterium]